MMFTSGSLFCNSATPKSVTRNLRSSGCGGKKENHDGPGGSYPRHLHLKQEPHGRHIRAQDLLFL